MLLTDYLDEIQGTQQETDFIEKLNQPEIKQAFTAASKVPVVGKMMAALVALADCSIGEIKDSSHYAALEGYEIKIDPNTDGFSIMPGSAMKKQMLIIAGVVVAIIAAFIIWRKIRKKRKYS